MHITHYLHASTEHADRCEDTLLILNQAGYAPVFAVIDGMGGHQRTAPDGTLISGREAAQMVSKVLKQFLGELPPNADASPGSDTEQRLKNAVIQAHRHIRHELNGGDIGFSESVGAVATVVIICENGQRLLTAQVGDTRGYLVSDGDLIQMIPDEDNVEFLVQRGTLSEEDGAIISDLMNVYDGINEPDVEGKVTIDGQEFDLYLAWRWFMVGNSALSIPGANVVINALGVEDEDPMPLTSRIEIAPGDMLLLCSDGVYKNLSHEEMLKHLGVGENHAAAVGEAAYLRSQDKTNKRMNPDDVSALVVAF
jgi:serine/threonine protein phosphatase PrpC